MGHRLAMLRLLAPIALCLLPALAGVPASALAQSEETAVSPVATEEPAAEEAAPRRGPSGLPLPRFVTLRSDEVNLRTGPGVRYPIDWVFQREGLPLQVIDEFENWRRVRDRDDTVGWVHRAMLSGQRRVVIVERQALRAEPLETAEVLAYLDAGFLAGLQRCPDGWCALVADGPDGSRYRGWLPRQALWGVLDDEVIE
ncbi:MAG: hypothetical protein Kilf2KO_43660 [Rhodospirillales bacterium]